MKKITHVSSLCCILAFCFSMAAEDKPATAETPARKAVIDVTFSETGGEAKIADVATPVAATTAKTEKGFAAMIGSRNGVVIPAAALFGQKEGTIICKFKLSEPKKNFTVPRYFLTLRGEGRTWIGFCFYPKPNDKKLVLNFRYIGESVNIRKMENLTTGTWHEAVCTWDGYNVRLYLDGAIVGEQEQHIPANFPAGSTLNLGAFKDAYIAAKPWDEDDIMISNVIIYNKAMSMEDIAASTEKKDAVDGKTAK